MNNYECLSHMVRRDAATPALHIWIEFELSVVLGAIVVDDLFCNREKNGKNRSKTTNNKKSAPMREVARVCWMLICTCFFLFLISSNRTDRWAGGLWSIKSTIIEHWKSGSSLPYAPESIGNSYSISHTAVRLIGESHILPAVVVDVIMRTTKCILEEILRKGQMSKCELLLLDCKNKKMQTHSENK